MNATFRLNADDLDLSMIEKIKNMFAHHPIEIAVLERDETEYLLSNPQTRERLLGAIEDLTNGTNFVELDPKLFQ